MKKLYEKDNVVYQAESESEFERYLLERGFQEAAQHTKAGEKAFGRDRKPQEKE